MSGAIPLLSWRSRMLMYGITRVGAGAKLNSLVISRIVCARKLTTQLVTRHESVQKATYETIQRSRASKVRA